MLWTMATKINIIDQIMSEPSKIDAGDRPDKIYQPTFTCPRCGELLDVYEQMQGHNLRAVATNCKASDNTMNISFCAALINAKF